MKVLLVNVVADIGSTGKICGCIDDGLATRGYESLVCYGRNKAIRACRRYKFGREWEAAVSKVANRCGRLMYASSILSTRRLIKKIKTEAPDIVHLHCINGYCADIYALLRFLAQEQIKTIVTHHAEFFYTGNCGHALDCTRFMGSVGCGDCPRPKSSMGALWRDRSASAWVRMRDAFALFPADKLLFTAVSPWLSSRAGLSDITNKYPCIVVENGLDTSVFRCREDRYSARSIIPNCGSRIILHVTASFSDTPDNFKGGDKVIELARRMPDVTFVIACSYSNVTGTLPPNIYLHGRTKDQHELAELYNAADLTIIASKKETFSMVVAESLCCGTPVAGFQAGGPESICIGEYAEFVEYGSIAALERACRSMLDTDFDPVKIATEAQSKFSSERMVDNYIKIYERLVK